MRHLTILIASFAVTSQTACANAAPPPGTASCSRAWAAAEAKSALAKTIDEKLEPGVTLAIYYPTRWHDPVSAAAGYADYALKTAIAPDAVMPAGSIGKTFFGAAALKLAEDGKLNLDLPIGDILTNVDIPNGDKVTTRMLLAHKSGYGEYDATFMEDLIHDPLRQRSLTDWLGPIQRASPDPPGTFRYSDINFVLVAEIVSATSGERWDQYIDRNFLRPFGLSHTRAALSPSIAGLTPGYAGPKNFFGRDAMMESGRLIYNPQFESGGGGYVSSAPDLARWIVRLASANAYSPSSWALASAPTHPPDDKGNTYGLGVHIDRTSLGTAYGHSGYIPGYVSWVRYYEVPGIAIAIQTNTSDKSRLRWDGYELMDTLAGRIVASCGG